MTAQVVYIDVVKAAGETATKILALRGAGSRVVHTTTDGGKTASVDWNNYSGMVTLNLPSLPADAYLSRAEADRLVAFIVHECCHVLHSDQKAWEEACKEGWLVKTWTNALEDVRIEAKEIALGHFPAMRSLLSSMTNKLTYGAVVDGVVGSRFIDAPFVTCVLGRLANGYAIPAAALLARNVKPEVQVVVDRALAALPACKTTHDVLALARVLADMTPKVQPQPPRPNDPPPPDLPGNPGEQPGEPQDGQDGPGEPGKPQDSQDGPGEPQDGQQQQDGPSLPGEPQDGQQQDGPAGGVPGSLNEAPPADNNKVGQNQEVQQQDANDNPQGGGGAGQEQGPEVSLEDISDMVQDIMDREGIEKNEQDHEQWKGSHRLIGTKVTVEDVAGDEHGKIANNNAAKNLNEIFSNGVLHGQISRLLVSTEIRRVTHRETTGRLDRRALTRMSTGARDVFSQKHEMPGVETALCVLVDCSLSMNDKVYGTSLNRLSMAVITGWHIAKAAEAANAKVCVAGFEYMYEGAKIKMLKPWDRSCGDSARTMTALKARGSTPMSPSILEISRAMADMNATRKIIMVLTDGGCDYGEKCMHAACNLAGDMGVEVVGIGMNCKMVLDMFPAGYSVNVENLKHLAKVGLGVLCDMLEDADMTTNN